MIAISRLRVLRSSCIGGLYRRLSGPKPATHLRTYTFDSYLIGPGELHKALRSNEEARDNAGGRNVVPVCAAWFLPNDPHRRTGLDAFKAARVPGSRFFDIDRIKDPSSPYPHMLPSAKDFAKSVGSLGIRREDTVVVYDTADLGIFSAPRVGWTFRVFGHPRVHVLNNFRLWREQHLPVQDGDQDAVSPVHYPLPTLDPRMVAQFEDVKDIASARGVGVKDVQILDARSRGRWEGTEKEPRPELPSGHIPGSTTLAAPLCLDPETKAYWPASRLRSIFEKHGIDPSKPIITTCGTGVTAAILETALMVAGYSARQRRIYDGSWTEWAQRVRPTESLISTCVNRS